MTATVIPVSVLEAKRAERERQRRDLEALRGTILDPLAHEDDQQHEPETPKKEHTR